jgi:CheY-like chemotaxis protein
MTNSPRITPGEHCAANAAPDGRLLGLRLLVLDDEPTAREMLGASLELYGAAVRAAISVPDALEVLKRWHPDALISDVGMPEMDGFDLIRELRALSSSEGRDTPAIALTGYVSTEDQARALASGYQLFLPKPVDLDELMKAVECLCANKLSRS